MVPALNHLTATAAASGPDVTAMASNLRDADVERQQAAAEQFESVFVSLILKQMRQSIDGDGLFSGDNSDVYGGLFDMYMGQHLSKASEFGVGKLILQYLEASKIQ